MTPRFAACSGPGVDTSRELSAVTVQPGRLTRDSTRPRPGHAAWPCPPRGDTAAPATLRSLSRGILPTSTGVLLRSLTRRWCSMAPGTPILHGPLGSCEAGGLWGPLEQNTLHLLRASWQQPQLPQAPSQARVQESQTYCSVSPETHACAHVCLHAGGHSGAGHAPFLPCQKPQGSPSCASPTAAVQQRLQVCPQPPTAVPGLRHPQLPAGSGHLGPALPRSLSAPTAPAACFVVFVKPHLAQAQHRKDLSLSAQVGGPSLKVW